MPAAVMPSLSIRARLNVTIGALLILAFAVNLTAIVLGAGPRIRAENDNMVKLTRQMIERTLSGLSSSADPVRDLAGLLERLSDIRHARVALEPLLPDLAYTHVAGTLAKPNGVPDWFARMVAPQRAPVRLPVSAGLTPLGTIIITSNPGDEIAEIWEAVKGTALIGLALIGAVFALTSLAIAHALRPIDTLGAALRSMEGGNYGILLETSGPPELAGIAAKINDLAHALTRTRLENLRLTGEIIEVEDRERRELARELHDEFGPYLFAIRANLTAIQGHDGAPSASAAPPAFAAKCAAALEQVGALQQVNRRVLQRLRPPALAELGLTGALNGLIAQWQDGNPDIAITLSAGLEEGSLGHTTALTVYRVVQEGLTNALRHANAAHIWVTVTQVPDGPVKIQIKDDGDGIAAGAKPGIGLSGMGERVWALGGTLSLSNDPVGGVVLDVELPCPRENETIAAGGGTLGPINY